MLRVSAIVLCLFLSSKILAQSCPSLIYPLNGSSNISVNATISWNNVDGVTGYIISIGTVPGGNDIIQSQTSNNSFSPPLGLPDNTQIYITITLFFFNLPNIQCSSQSFKTEDIIIPPVCTFLLSPKDGATNVNVGANFGYYICMARNMGVRSISIEPIPVNQSILKRNLVENNWDQNVILHPVACGNSDENITIYGDGQQTRTFCYIDDHLEATVGCLTNNMYIDKIGNLIKAVDVELKKNSTKFNYQLFFVITKRQIFKIVQKFKLSSRIIVFEVFFMIF